MPEVGHKGDLGPCWWEDCTDPGAELVLGVPVTPVGVSPEVAATAGRITRLGLVACPEHADLARAAAGGR